MFTAIALVCSYTEPQACYTVASNFFYPTYAICMEGRNTAEEILGTTTQGVRSFQCIAWGEPA